MKSLPLPQVMYIINATGETNRGRDFDELFKVQEVQAVTTSGSVWYIWNPDKSAQEAKAYNIKHNIFPTRAEALQAALNNALLFIKQEGIKQLARVKATQDFINKHDLLE